MPSSADRRRLEIPTYLHEQLSQIAETEGRTVASVAHQVLFWGLGNYRPEWIPDQHLQRLRQRARNALDLAEQEARGFDHNYIGTEHVLLGLVREQGGLAAQVLSGLGVDVEGVRAGVERIVGRGDAPVEGEIEYVPRVRRVLGLALDEARRLDHGIVRTEHILLALVRDGGGVGASILDDIGVLGRVRGETFAAMGRREPGEVSSPDRPT